MQCARVCAWCDCVHVFWRVELRQQQAHRGLI